MVRQVNESGKEREIKLRDESEHWMRVKEILYTNDKVLMAESREDLQKVVKELKRD